MKFLFAVASRVTQPSCNHGRDGTTRKLLVLERKYLSDSEVRDCANARIG